MCDLQGDHFTFDYIGISEIFSCDRDICLVLPGYHDLLSRTRDDDTHGRVGLFIKDHLSYRMRNDLSVFISYVFESIFIEIIPDSNNKAKKCKL